MLPTWTETGGSVGGCHAAVPSVLGSTNGFTDVCGYRALFFGQQFVPEADQFGLRVGGLYDGQPAWVGIRGLSPPHYAVSRIACTVVHYGEGGKLTIVLRDSAGAVVESREVVAGGEVIVEGSGLGSLEFVDSLTPDPLGMPTGTFWYGNVRFLPDCTRPADPIQDTLINNGDVRALFGEALFRSNADSNALKRTEVGGWLYRRSNGTYFAKYHDDPNATSCSFTLPASAPPDPEGVAVAGFHTHPHNRGDEMHPFNATSNPTGCRKVPAGKRGTAEPLKNGGGSDEDWAAASLDGALAMYDVAKHKTTVTRLLPTLWGAQNNPYQWRINRQEPYVCAQRVSQ